MNRNIVLIEAVRTRPAGRGGKSFTIVHTPLYMVDATVAPAIIAELTKTNATEGQTFQVSSRVPTFLSVDDFTKEITAKQREAALAKLSDKDRALLGLPPAAPVAEPAEENPATEAPATEVAAAEPTAAAA